MILVGNVCWCMITGYFQFWHWVIHWDFFWFQASSMLLLSQPSIPIYSFFDVAVHCCCEFYIFSVSALGYLLGFCLVPGIVYGSVVDHLPCYILFFNTAVHCETPTFKFLPIYCTIVCGVHMLIVIVLHHNWCVITKLASLGWQHHQSLTHPLQWLWVLYLSSTSFVQLSSMTCVVLYMTYDSSPQRHCYLMMLLLEVSVLCMQYTALLFGSFDDALSTFFLLLFHSPSEWCFWLACIHCSHSLGILCTQCVV